MTAIRSLTPIEARVLATLMEKARTVPDTYPMSLNGVVTGCNQKTSRDPVMTVSDAEAQEALDELKRLSLVTESHGSRVVKYEHNFQRGVGVPDQSAVLLGLLMLRGPQTAGELRINAERWYRFADISSVQAFLDELAERSAEKGGPLVVQLARAPGERETRWAHLLCGPVAAGAPTNPDLIANNQDGVPTRGPYHADSARLAALELEVAALRETVARLCAELGVSPAQPDAGGAHAKNDGSQET